VLRADVTGLFYPSVVKGQTVEAGEFSIGPVTDFHGHTLESISALFPAKSSTSWRRRL
jgi:hypothetical protein